MPDIFEKPTTLTKLSLWWLLSPPLAYLFYQSGPLLPHLAIILSLATALSAIALANWRLLLSHLTAVLLTASCLCLVFHLLIDHFHYNYVWLYSGEALPWYLKLSNLWGGEEGTLLLLAALFAILATRLVNYQGWSGQGPLLMTAVFALAAIIWHPFELTPSEDLQRLPSQGMNVHLTRVWMALHPPLIFIAYVFILAPLGSAFQALIKGESEWVIVADRYSRSGWLILSAGLASGMWWAYEDFTFGQFWHWDPVQTSVFIVWALVTAYLHGLRFYRAGYMTRVLPLLALLTAVAVFISMLVTRNQVLASSHRYIGDTSFPVLAIIASILFVGSLVAYGYSLTRRITAPKRQHESVLLIRIAVITFSLIATVAAFYLTQAYIAAYLELPRPASLKPFFEMLARWSQPQELVELRQAFAQWDIDNFAINTWLAPLGLIVGLFGGHAFLRLENRLIGWLITVCVAVAALTIAYYLEPLDQWYRGTGMTSRHTVAIFFWLNAMLVAGAYLILSALVWLVRMKNRSKYRTAYSYYLPVGLIHIGAMLALLGAISASVLDSYAQQTLSYPEDFGQIKRFPDGYSLRVDVASEAFVNDGGRIDSQAQQTGFQSVGKVQLIFEQEGQRSITGNTVFRDTRAPLTGERGSVRQLCEILDYRYARYTSDSGYRLDPFIQRGFWQDVQVWLPAVDYSLDEAGIPQRQSTSVAVVIKTYPLISLLWLGLILILVGATLMTYFAWHSRYRLYA